MIRRQTAIALGVAIFFGLIAVYLANTYLLASQNRAALGGTTPVAVAAAPLDYGTELTADKIRFADYPNSALPAGSFHDLKDIFPAGQKRVVLTDIQPNEPILTAKISAPGSDASIAALLPAGMRATSVRINDVSGVAGFIQPNDSVDVLITRSVAGRDDQVTDVLMQNVRVLAIGQNAKSADGKPIDGKTATLLVDQLGAQKLALAQQVGTLSLVLRKPGDQTNPVVETVSLNDLRDSLYGGVHYPAQAAVGSYGSGLGGAISGAMRSGAGQIASTRRASSQRTKKAAPARKPIGNDIQVYRGTKGDSYTVGG
jgi:pilus assembly protein CpaB